MTCETHFVSSSWTLVLTMHSASRLSCFHFHTLWTGLLHIAPQICSFIVDNVTDEVNNIEVIFTYCLGSNTSRCNRPPAPSLKTNACSYILNFISHISFAGYDFIWPAVPGNDRYFFLYHYVVVRLDRFWSSLRNWKHRYGGTKQPESELANHALGNYTISVQTGECYTGQKLERKWCNVIDVG